MAPGDGCMLAGCCTADAVWWCLPGCRCWLPAAAMWYAQPMGRNITSSGGCADAQRALLPPPLLLSAGVGTGAPVGGCVSAGMVRPALLPSLLLPTDGDGESVGFLVACGLGLQAWAHSK
jgi:hypothetical protein